MNRAALMLGVLQGRGWCSRHDIFERAGKFFLTNNAASELRAMGYEIEERRFQGNYEYRLAGKPQISAGDMDPDVEDGALPKPTPSSIPAEQLSLEAA